MKKIIVILAVILIVVSGCSYDIKSKQTYYGSTLIIADEQVWLRNHTTNRLSQAYEMFNERDYNITVLSEYLFNGYSEEIGFGTIRRGKLSFTVNAPIDLLEWKDLKVFFNTITEGKGWDVEINNAATKGTFILPVTDVDEYALIREGLSGTTSSISDESVYFIYVDKDCTITGKSKEDQVILYTFYPFTLKLKKGWNTIWYKQTYTSYGKSFFSMDIKNPDLKWVLIPTAQTN
ncbi:MAG: hypothetical protein LBI14_05505 [Treponema sp.]|jgi:uncharacterized protein YxeA|nr:hypothetical protein [Treponema sp.]